MCDSTGRVISEFRNSYAFLSNFFESPLIFDGIVYMNAEAAFQAQKCLTDEEKQEFSYLTPVKAKRKGKQVSLRADWDEVKLELMEEIIRAKFTDNGALRSMLLATGDAKLEEGNTWNDTFWGIDIKTGAGENHLGKILMKIREELRS